MTWWLPGWPSPRLLSAYRPLGDTSLTISPVSFLATLQGFPVHIVCVSSLLALVLSAHSHSHSLCHLLAPIFLLWVSAQLKPPPAIFQVGLGAPSLCVYEDLSRLCSLHLQLCTSGVLSVCLLWLFFFFLKSLYASWERHHVVGSPCSFLRQWLSHWNQSINA